MKAILVLMLLVAPLAANAELRVFACEPEWAALADELGGDLVSTDSATTALQDPHYIQARPSLIAKVRRADLIVCSGAQLEIGWLPQLLQKANNRDVMQGTDGFLEASRFVKRLEVGTSADRAQGDIHPLGNPHVQADPRNIAAVARVLATRMGKIDNVNSTIYDINLEEFIERWNKAIDGWETQAANLRGKRVIAHHRSWVYLENWLGLDEVANLEPVPGLPPTAAHLSRLTTQFADGSADVIIRAPYQDARASEWLSERTGIPAIALPLTVGGTDEAADLFALFDDIVARLKGAMDDA